MSANTPGTRPIAVIGGTGPAGMGLALRWARAGEIVIIGSRNEERAQQTAAAIQRKAGPDANVSGMENSAACAAADILMLTVPFEAQATLIKQLKPRFNVQMRDDKSFPEILIRRDHPAPQIRKHRGAHTIPGEYFGPFASAWAVNRTVNSLQKAFLLEAPQRRAGRDPARLEGARNRRFADDKPER